MVLCDNCCNSCCWMWFQMHHLKRSHCDLVKSVFVMFNVTGKKLEKGFQKKPIFAFTNSTVFILDFNI